MAKLDPANWKSAKDVYDERSAEAAKKRKREEQDDSKDISTNQNAHDAQEQQTSKKRKRNDPSTKPVIVGKVGDLENPDQIENKNLKKKMKKRANRLEKNREMREQKEQRKAERSTRQSTSTPTAVIEPSKNPEKPSQQPASAKGQERVLDPTPAKARSSLPAKSQRPTKEASASITMDDVDTKAEEAEEDESEGEEIDKEDAWSDVDEDMTGFDKLNSMQDDDDEVMEDASSTTSSSENVPEILSPPQDSAASSVSSVLPPATTSHTKSINEDKNSVQSRQQTRTAAKTIQTEAERSAARQRLQEQISQFRSQRKADDRPIRSRAELLEQRRRTEAERKAAKKEQRRKQKEEEARLQDEEMARRFSPGGSGSLLASPRSPVVDTGANESFSFGRIAFEDGTQLDANTLSAVASKKHKGASDPASALKAAQTKNARIAGLDEEKKQDIQEKDMWLNARKRAHGERIKDDTSLLKKALKRQEKQKQRSEKDWDKRIEGVRASQDAKQKRRTENLQKRKDEKSSKKSGKGNKSGKKVKRPGFEGSFRGRTGKSKKN